MTATCILADGGQHDLEDQKADRRLRRGDATVLIDNMPIQRAFHKPSKVVYKRIPKHRFVPLKAKYVPSRPKYPWKINRKPTKMHPGKFKHRTPSHKKRSPRPRNGLAKRPAAKPMYRPKKKKSPHSFTSNSHKAEHQTFGEPPISFSDYPSFQSNYNDNRNPSFSEYPKSSSSDFQTPGTDFHKVDSSKLHMLNFNNIQKLSLSDFQKPSIDEFNNQNFDEYPSDQGHGEPPVDSYGAPIKVNLHDLVYHTAQNFPDTSSDFDPDTQNNDQTIDNKYAFTKKLPTFTTSDDDVFVTSIPKHSVEEQGLNSYSDIYKHRQMEGKQKSYQNNNMKIMNKPWKNKMVNDEMIVGGQYAEPPARYVLRSQRLNGPPGHISNTELAASAANSPYVNYKNSNMAFSPQNLNDAFST